MGTKRPRRSHRRRRGWAPPYARLAVLALATVLVVVVAWNGFHLLLRWFGHGAATQAAEPVAGGVETADPWERDVLESIDAARAEAGAGNVTNAEMAVDRAGSLIEAGRIQGKKPPLAWFEIAIGSLDGTLRPHPDNERLVEHVTLARIELAQLRSSLVGAPGVAKAGAETTNDAALAPNPNSEEEKSRASSTGERTEQKHVELRATRTLTAYHVLDPVGAGGDWIDATRLPETAEVLQPPLSRLLVDNVRVQNLTIEGGAQTLDGVHWKNVTLVGTRVRYEDGEVDLRNVHFLRCTFGITTDERGARLASAIALGQSSIVIN